MDAIRKIETALAAGPTDGEWRWCERPDDELSPASVYAEPREGHAYAVFMCPRYGIETFPVNAEYALSVQPKNIREVLQTLASKEAEIARLRSALNAMLTHMGMDEDEWNKPTFDQARSALRGVS